MHIRDLELSRMIKYAEGLGVRVSFRIHKNHDAAALWEVLDGNVTIVLFTWPKQSKTTLILNFLHELAHHKAWINANREFSKSVEAATSTPDKDLTDHQRYLVYKEEKNDAKLRLGIANELNLKIPEWKIKVDIANDNWYYYRWWKTGEDPSRTERIKKEKQFTRKYKNASKSKET